MASICETTTTMPLNYLELTGVAPPIPFPKIGNHTLSYFPQRSRWSHPSIHRAQANGAMASTCKAATTTPSDCLELAGVAPLISCLKIGDPALSYFPLRARHNHPAPASARRLLR
jgi:hypothetical protein